MDWNDIPIIGPLIEWLSEAASALANGMAALWQSKEVFLDALYWLPASIVGTLTTLIGIVIIMKLFGR